MKNILFIIVLIYSSNNFAQSPILSLENRDTYNTQNGAYYKDLNNVLNQYEGTWLYSNGNTTLKIILVKKSMFFEGKYYEDLMIGEYQYIENGVEKINTLPYLNQNLGYNHKIKGNIIFNDCDFLPCDDCIIGEKRLSLGLIDAITPHWGRLILHKRTINNQQAIKAVLVFNYNGKDYEDTPTPSPTLPWQGEYVLFKQ